MRYRLRDVPALLRTPIGREELRVSAWLLAWPVYRAAATAWRRFAIRRTRMAVVVGSLGKTTAQRALKAVFDIPLKGNLNANGGSGLATHMLAIPRGAAHGVVEVGVDRPGQMAPYARLIRPDIVVVCSVASDHDETFPGFEAKIAEKGVMPRALGPEGLAVLNGDDPNVMRMAAGIRARITTFGFGPGNEARAEECVIEAPDRMRLRAVVAGEAVEFRLRVIGRHMAYSILAAAAVGRAEGLPLKDIKKRLEALEPMTMRMEPIRMATRAWLIRDEYKASVEALEAALETLAAIPARRRFAALGAPSDVIGDKGAAYRRLGSVAAKAVDAALFVGDPEEFALFSEGAGAGGLEATRLRHAGKTAFEALSALPRDLGEGDVILVKGAHYLRMDRLSLALMGRAVQCRATRCTSLTVRCARCPMVEHDWTAGTAPI